MLLGEALADRASKKKQLDQIEARAASAVQVADLRAEADQIVEARRRLDVRIQQAGWST